MKSLHFFGFDLPFWAVALGAYCLWVAAGWALKNIFFKWLRFLTSKTETRWDDVLISSANLPFMLMICVWGIAAVIRLVAPDFPSSWSNTINLSSKIATLAAVILFVDLVLKNSLIAYAEKVSVLRGSQTFVIALIHVVVIALGSLVILDSIGISITPIIASLGIGSLAVALALQPTFENIFAGLQILIDQPILPGHYVRLESGEEGTVEKIGWRSSWIRQIPNNMVIIPNKQLVSARIINFNYPSPDQAFLVEVGVRYGADLDHVERVTLEVAEKVLQTVPGAVANFKPFVRFHTLAGSSINMSVTLRAQSVPDFALVRHEFLKALMKRYSKENIQVPYPILALNTSQEKAAEVQLN